VGVSEEDLPELDDVRVEEAGMVDQFAADVLKGRETRAKRDLEGLRIGKDGDGERRAPESAFPLAFQLSHLGDLVAALKELDGPVLAGFDLLGEDDKAKGAW